MSQNGQKVLLRYEIFAEDGSKAASNLEDKNPQEIFLGRGQLMPALEKVLAEMEPEQSQSIELEAADAFGMPDERLIKTVNIHKVAEKDRKVGTILDLEDNEGHICSARIADVDTEHNKITLDFNHPLAGQRVKFVIRLC